MELKNVLVHINIIRFKMEEEYGEQLPSVDNHHPRQSIKILALCV